ncbi:response regulator [Paenibacillus sp. NEAU-GSW1]|uniref:response regulator n=1 Tax=Paenibacillus sp. NEAU-GSW1 TaxID=2682486 RepID=UPI0012E0D2C8|nr:response regulator [Paenibacillus sp. NEAU-GSW1]MUT68781.1 response regulator [Paenibacillus sp. NEAU-GSW1]
MYTILVVDDEPLICKGLCSLLTASGIDIENIHMAHSGYEALDYLRAEDIDLLVTDIQMGSMNGIELMQQAKMIKPWVETIIISAHETFQYAQMAIRLGAKDYLIKPLNGDQFLDSVRNVLLKMHKQEPAGHEELIAGLREHFHMAAPIPQSVEWLNRLVADPRGEKELAAKLESHHGIRLAGPYFAMLRLKLNWRSDAAEDDAGKRERELSAGDVKLLQYAALNITNELMSEQLQHAAYYGSDDELCVILQWNEERYEEAGSGRVNELDMIGRSLFFNIRKFLAVSVTIGISQILKGIEFLDVLNEQAAKALQCSRQHRDHYVFYYGDFNWSLYPQQPSEEELNAQTSMIVDKAKSYINDNYAQKGLTLQEVAQSNHVSPNYLSYLFKKETGINLWEYVIKLRMEESKRLLLQTDLRRYEISERVGYESPEHFSKIFKKYYGVSPSELKK